MNNKTKKHMKEIKEIIWTVHGINWTYKVVGDLNTCPVEIATRGVEFIWKKDNSELWKDMDPSCETLELAPETEPGLGIIVVIENSEMTCTEEHLVVSSPVILANAGLYSESARIQKEWDKVAEEDKIASLLKYLQGGKI
jgi:hypothetical protein